MSEQSTPRSQPEPEPVRFFGTSWVTRDNGYWLRRALVPPAALLAAVAGALLLRFAVTGVGVGSSDGLVYGLLVAAIAISTCLAAVRTWKLLAEGRDSLTGWMAEDRQLGVVWIIGGVGSLLAYFLRSLREAPGEAVVRARYERAVSQHERRRAGRSGRPGAKRRR